MPAPEEAKQNFLTLQFQTSPQMACLRGCIVIPVTFCFTFLCCVFSNLLSTMRFSNIASKHMHGRMQSHTGNICMTFLHCVFSNVFSNRLHEKWHSHIGCIFLLYSTVSFQMWPQCTWIRAGKIQAPEEAKSHWLHFYFSLLCVFKCVFKWPAWEEA